MTPEMMFSLANLVAMVGWLLLIAAPRRAAALSVAATGIPLVLAAAYLVLIAVSWRGSSGGFSSLAGVSALFSNPWLLLAGWVHYLAFDLFVGAWETRDAMERSISRWLLVPCLFLTFMFGPIGWLLYRLVSALHGSAAAGQPRASRMPRQIPA